VSPGTAGLTWALLVFISLFPSRPWQSARPGVPFHTDCKARPDAHCLRAANDFRGSKRPNASHPPRKLEE